MMKRLTTNINAPNTQINRLRDLLKTRMAIFPFAERHRSWCALESRFNAIDSNPFD